MRCSAAGSADRQQILVLLLLPSRSSSDLVRDHTYHIRALQSNLVTQSSHHNMIASTGYTCLPVKQRSADSPVSPSDSSLLPKGCWAASFYGILPLKVSAVTSRPARQPGACRQPPVRTAACRRYTGHRRAELVSRVTLATSCE